jgi:hypothetical protein
VRTNWRAAAIAATAALLAGCGGSGTDTNEGSPVLPLTEANGAQNAAAPEGAAPPAVGAGGQAGSEAAAPQPVTGAPPQPGAAPPQPTGAPPPAAPAPAPAPAPGSDAPPPALEQDYTTGNDHQGHPPG